MEIFTHSYIPSPRQRIINQYTALEWENNEGRTLQGTIEPLLMTAVSSWAGEASMSYARGSTRTPAVAYS